MCSCIITLPYIPVGQRGIKSFKTHPKGITEQHHFVVAPICKVPTWMWVIRATQDAVAENAMTSLVRLEVKLLCAPEPTS